MAKDYLKGLILASFVLSLVLVPSLFSHCQIPCGIYGDEMRFQMIEEDLQTIEKSMIQITELAAATPVNYNQLVRWINNKDEHSQKIQDIVNAYFLTQRIKLVDPSDAAAYTAYLDKLSMLHHMLVLAMECKQTTDTANPAELRKVLNAFHEVYFSKEDKEHLKEHMEKGKD
jgi:nickel superoxide dismutase